MFAAFRAQVATARRHGDLYFASLLSAEVILSALGVASSLWQGWIYTPEVTVWVFLSQCLSADHSCRDAVAGLAAWRVAQGLYACSADTGAYCTAREHLPETACLQLVRQTGKELEDQAPPKWLWHGRRVRVADGATFTMPDTAENQAEYPQQKNQKPGCGFPIARMLVVFSLAVGTVLEVAIRPYEGKLTGENSMFRTLHDSLAAGDVVLADRYFSGWFDLALLHQRGVDVVVRKHQLRVTDFRVGRRLGHDDHVVCWTKPARPDWMSRKDYAALPDELAVRELRVRVTQRGFRPKSLVIVTTLFDAKEFSAEAIADLYRQRWQAELNLRSLKTVLTMEHLRCKTPHRVRNELYMHLLGYNLVRKAMALAAFDSGVCPWQVSFKGTLQTLNNFLPLLGSCMDITEGCESLLTCIAAHAVGNRPDRYEPRVIKRPPKKYKRMREPRHDYKRRAA
jgi:DDE family transposase